MKLAVWNMEWLNDLFTDKDGPLRFKPDDAEVRGPHPPWERSGPTVGERRALLKQGLEDLDADIYVVVEGPNTTEELQLFFDELAPGTWVCFAQRSTYPRAPGGSNQGSSQCVGLAVRTDTGLFKDTPFTAFDSLDPASGLIHDATEPFHLDLGQDKVFEWFRYERRPLYSQIHPAQGADFRILGLHLKSKGVFGAYEWSKWWQLADANRERLLAQCRHLREHFLDKYLADPAEAETPLIVCGDINDGPGFDTSEMRLNASGVETLMGSVWKPNLVLGNALFDTLSEDKKATMDFEGLATTRFADPIFNDTHHRVWIDHILYSQGEAGWVANAAIPRETADRLAYWKISDHYPVTADIAT